MKKRVLLLAVSCKKGGLCPGGVDLDDPKSWIRIVKEDESESVQGVDIDFARPLDIIEFEGRHVPQGKQKENWVIDNFSCKKIDRIQESEIEKYYRLYGYHDFWGNYRSYLNEEEFKAIDDPTESILLVKDVRIYKNQNNKPKIDFLWTGKFQYPIRGVSMTDQDFYSKINDGNEVYIEKAYIVISIPKDLSWEMPNTGEKRAYKFVSRIFGIKECFK